MTKLTRFQDNKLAALCQVFQTLAQEAETIQNWDSYHAYIVVSEIFGLLRGHTESANRILRLFT